MRRAILVAFTLSVLGLGCQLANDWADGERQPADKYGVFTGDYYTQERLRSFSPLVTIDETGSINLCIQGPGGTSLDGATRDQIENAARRAVRAWNQLLNEPAPPDHEGYTFPPWRRADVVVNFTCSSRPAWTIIVDFSNDRAYAEPWERRMRLDSSCTDEERAMNVITHEYGHLMGLADTYYEPANGLDVDGQPDSMMHDAMGFTDDDRAAIWNLWRYLVYGGSPCGPGYEIQATREYQTYCILSPDDDTSMEDGDESGGSGDGGGAGDGSGSCEYPCDILGLTPGQCALDSAGNPWFCNSAGCLRFRDSCDDEGGSGGDGDDWGGGDDGDDWGGGDDGDDWGGGDDGEDWGGDDSGGDWSGGGESCDYSCDILGLSPGECTWDADGYAWACDETYCLHYVESCGGDDWGGDDGSDDWGGGGESCDYSCDILGLSPGECTWDADGFAWACDETYCLYYIEDC